ncbi:MAG TPA: S8 family serine peptidase [Anaerolineae bacterium]|nr:S8 family serine peptidase [Anaerolineae bacterium]
MSEANPHTPEARRITRYVRISLVTLIVIVVGYLCSRIVGPAQVTRAFSCELDAPASAAEPTLPSAQAVVQQAALGVFFVESQVIVIGPADAIATVTNTVESNLSVTLTRAINCDLGYLGQLRGVVDRNASIGPFPATALDSLKLQLYRVTTTLPVSPVLLVSNVVNEINAVASANNLLVIADPNYLTAGTAGDQSCGDPYGTGGSPYGTGGSPYGTGGSPIGGMGPQAASALFAKQWALEHIGLGLTLQYSSAVAARNGAGQGIRIGVFDTAPAFTETAVTLQTGERILTKTIDWISPPMTLTVVPSSSLPNIQLRPSVTNTEILSDVSDHGLFVAGLIHEIAPASDIVLYEVLNPNGCGTLFALVTRLYEFVSQVNLDRDQLRGAVINLSLGVLKPLETGVILTTAFNLPETGSISVELKLAQAILKTDAVESLLLTTHAAYQSGIVVVAAAGNDSWPNHLQSLPADPQLPAAYSFVIGVAGSAANRQRSCFANWGDVSAPAGEGGEGVAPITATSTITQTLVCAPKTQDCAGDCPTAIIGPVLTATAVFTSHFAYWSGTSFSAPLVSGLAALTLQTGARPKDIGDILLGRAQIIGSPWMWMFPSDVARAIKCGAATGDGIINVPTTLGRCIWRSQP